MSTSQTIIAFYKTKQLKKYGSLEIKYYLPKMLQSFQLQPVSSLTQ